MISSTFYSSTIRYKNKKQFHIFYNKKVKLKNGMLTSRI